MKTPKLWIDDIKAITDNALKAFTNFNLSNTLEIHFRLGFLIAKAIQPYK